MVDFCDINKGFCVIFFIFLITTIQSCSNHSDKIESDVLAYQAIIDSLIATTIVPVQREINKQIVENNLTNKDTFQLARKRIPITKVQFLVSNEYFILDSLLTVYQNHKISATVLKEQLEFSQYRVDSLINSESMNVFSE